jgi:predicted adenine nucleotide alpha hydrolase (AANH) superfamily ATPase
MGDGSPPSKQLLMAVVPTIDTVPFISAAHREQAGMSSEGCELFRVALLYSCYGGCIYAVMQRRYSRTAVPLSSNGDDEPAVLFRVVAFWLYLRLSSM